MIVYTRASFQTRHGMSLFIATGKAAGFESFLLCQNEEN